MNGHLHSLATGNTAGMSDCMVKKLLLNHGGGFRETGDG